MRQRGFTLVEVLAALVILAIVTTTTLAVFVERQRQLREASETILAWQALANEVEYRRRIDFIRLDTAPAAFDPGNTAILAPLAPYAATVTVTTPQPDVKHVALTIRWQNGKRAASLEIIRVQTGGGNLF
ncbi:MAG TPA: type II secretion system protein [Thermoanaerobaculia bacterium]|nr:type II secretion system protein [Thermoanaerobaculia bacterium]